MTSTLFGECATSQYSEVLEVIELVWRNVLDSHEADASVPSNYEVSGFAWWSAVRITGIQQTSPKRDTSAYSEAYHESDAA